MNTNPIPDELQAALTRLIEGEAEPHDDAQVAEMLRSRPELHAQLRQQLRLDALLRLEAEPTAAEFVEAVAARTKGSTDEAAFLKRVKAALPSSSDVFVGVPPRPGWLQWRPLAAAAAGLVFGLFSASMVFAYAVPRVVAMATRLSELVDGSFESVTGAMPSGLPEEFGVWSGKEPNQVRVDVVDGERVLRFLECKRGPSAVYQLIDLRTLRIDPNEGEAKLVLSARIRDDRPEVGDPFRFSMHLSLFSGSPDSLRETWPNSKKEAISSGSAVLESRGGTPKSWRELSAKTLVPPGADFALVQIGVLDPGAFPKHSATFGEQFVDDVQLTLQIQPELPVRVAQR